MFEESLNCKKVYRAERIRQFDFYSQKLKRLQKFWGPFQWVAPLLALALCIVGVILSLATRSYAHWLFFVPAICLLMITEMVVEEVQTRLQLITDEHRDLLGATQYRASQAVVQVHPCRVQRWSAIHQAADTGLR
ncbi:hypothetical protein [Pseudomonas vanderleydeniana]|uniref:Uncharacterized protein n=1 Tax=Pseudomonas vanderleydeniana TaxID=2745495 RepID=A0A9E6PIA7_9PSED|nr:hypothetical protein [Pseudomonas vanderleydeniana]QXI26611.1 hypothetical protein HU752_022110 [Pseudomonas vanderleydeniana]